MTFFFCYKQLTLETFGEGRSTKNKSKPYKGGVVDGPENGPPPPPWAIPCEPNQMFSTHKIKLEVPHTSVIKVGFVLHALYISPNDLFSSVTCF